MSLIPITTPLREFKGHEHRVTTVAVFPDKRRMVTGSADKTVRLWDLRTGVLLKKMQGHRSDMWRLVVSRDGQLIASGDIGGEIIIWHGQTGVSLTQPIRAHSNVVSSLDFSPDGIVLATGAGGISGGVTKLWNTKTWEQEGEITCGAVQCIRFSPSGEFLAIATINCIEVYGPSLFVAFKAHPGVNLSLVWTPDGSRLLTCGNNRDSTICEWDTTTWQQVGDPWTGHTNNITAIAVNPTGTLVASASDDKHVRLWRLSDRQTVAIFEHSSSPECVTFLLDGNHILSGGDSRVISEWVGPQGIQDVDSTSHAVLAKRGKARMGNMPRDEALLDAQKVIQPDSSSHASRHTLRTFQTMLSKLDNVRGTVTRKLRQQYLSPSEADRAIRKVIDTQLDNAPLRVLDTTAGVLCDREAQISTFRSSIEYTELVSSAITHRDIEMKRVKEVVMSYFRYVMLSHKWEGKEPSLQDIQGKKVYQLYPVGGIQKLQSFCKTAHGLGYRWVWSDTCCIDKSNNVELQESVNSMFVWYRHCALTIVYLSDVPPSSKSGALAKSIWNTRGWTVQEFLAPTVILFYQKDWTPYLNDRTSNHKDSVVIMQELEDATGIDRRAVVAFRPGMTNAREKLQWASTRKTTLQEDIAYSLCGIFGVRLRVDYGEKKQNALGRLVQEIVAQSGDITALDWVGKSSEFNSCLPADIISYAAPPYALPSLSEDQIQTAVSSLRKSSWAVDLALRLYDQLDHTNNARFAHHRLHLPCIVFPVTEARLRPGRDQDTYVYAVKSDGLHDLQITTEDKFTPFSPARPPPAWQTILLVRPWNRDILDLHDPADDTHSVERWSMSESLSYNSLLAQTERIHSESQALRLMVRLGQPFCAFLLARQRNGAFKRIASDQDIIAQVKVKDMSSVDYMIDIRTLEIL